MAPGRVKSDALLLVLLAVILGALGQLAFRQEPKLGQLSGLVLFTLSAISLVAAIALVPLSDQPGINPSGFAAASSNPAANRTRFWALPVLVLGSGAVLYSAAESLRRSQTVPRSDLLLAWGLGLAAVMAGMSMLSGNFRRPALHVKMPSPRTVFILLLALAGLLLAAVRLETIPYVLSGDEAEMGLEAVQVMRGELTNPFTTGFMAHPTLYFFMLSMSLRIAGITTAALRWPMALGFAVSIIWLYRLAGRWYGERTAVLAAILYAGYHYALHYARLGISNLAAVYFLLGVLWYVQRGLDERRPWPWAVAGLLLGLSLYVYTGGRLIPVILAVFLLICWLQGARLWRDHGWHLAALLVVAVLAAAPLLNHWMAYPAEITARWRDVNILQNGWLENEALLTGKRRNALLLEQFVKSALAFHLYTDRTPNYSPGIPLLQFAPGILFLFGLVTCLCRPQRAMNLLLPIWFFSVVITGGMLLENPPNSSRLVLAIPAVLLLVALGLERVLDIAASAGSQPRWMSTAFALCLALVMSYASARFYFARYTQSRAYGGYNTEVANRMGLYLRSLGRGYTCYFYGAPRMFYSFGTIRYLALDVPGVDAPEQSGAPLDWLQSEGRPVFCFLPERLAEIETVKLRYPHGTLLQHLDPAAMPLFYSYEVSEP